MMIKVFFNFILAAKSPKGKEKIIRRAYKELVKIYGEDAVTNIKEANFEVIIEFNSWEETIFRVFTDVQWLGYGRILTGDIENNFNLCINRLRTVGIDSINVIINNEVEKAP